MVNKKILLTILLGMFLISFVSAGITYQEDNKTYTIDTWIPDWLGGDGTSTVTLIDNTDQCLINCGFHLSGYNEKSVNLVEDINFINRRGDDVSNRLRSINFKLGTYQDVEKKNYSNPIYAEEETCIELNETNQTNSTNESCYYEILDYPTYTEKELVWEEYDGQEVQGYWELKADAKKDTVSMDWIITFRGKELSEWEWWNTSWEYKRQINLTADVGKFSYLATINYSSNMNSDFSDLRFINNAEDTEFNYTIESYTSSTSAIVRIFSQGETSFYMYYGNPTATTTSSASDTHLNPVSYYYLDETSGNVLDAVGTNNGINNGATYTASGKINGAYSFDGTDDYINFTSKPLNSQTEYSISGWFKTSSATIQYIIQQRDSTSTSNQYWVLVNADGSVTWKEYDTGVTKRVYLTSSTGFADGNWHFFTITREATSAKLYIDNSLENSSTPTQLSTINRIFYIGKDGRDNYGHFNGYLDEIGIWDRALTSTEIGYLYNYTAPTYTVGDEEVNAGLSIGSITPTNNTKSTQSNNYFNMTVTPNNVELTNTSLYIFNTNGTYYNQTKTYEQNATLSESYSVNLDDDNYTWYMEACSIDLTNCTNTGNYTLRVDTIAPIINIYNPSGNLNSTKLPHNETLNYSITDNNSLSSCFYEYNGVNNSLNCSGNLLNFTYESGINNLSIYATDEFGLTSKETTNWTYKSIEGNTTYSNETIEGSLESFSVEITLREDLIISNSQIYYNGTNYSTSISNVGNIYTVYKNNLLIPGVDSNLNLSFYFKITLSDGTIVNTTTYNQTIKAVSIDDCSANSYKILTLYLNNEENYNNLTGTIDTIFRVYSSGKENQIIEYINEFTSVSSKTFCSNELLNNSNLILDGIIRYGGTNYVKEFYNIQSAELNNYPKNFELYAINESVATEFRVIYQGEDLTKVPNAVIQLLRQRFDTGEYIITEAPLTSSDSIALVHVDTTSNLYKINVYKDGVLLDSFDNLVFKCQSEITGECDLTLDTPIIPANIQKIYNLLDFSYSLNLTDNSIILDFGVPSGTTTMINMQLIQTKIIGTSTVCNKTVNSAGGQIICTYDQTPDESIIQLYVYVDGVLYISKAYKSVEDFSDLFGKNNFFIILILGLSLVGMVISSPEYTVWIGIITVILGGGLYLLNGVDFTTGLAGVIWLIATGIILVVEISKQNDR